MNKIAKKFDSGLFIDPFDVKHYPDRLVNIATGVEASLEVEQSYRLFGQRGRNDEVC